jgi:hypothetical protein
MATYVFRQAVVIVVLSACQLAGSTWLLFEENPAFHVNVIEVCNML